MLSSIVLALSLTLAPPPPPPSIGDAPRSVSLLEQETRTLEARVHSAQRLLPVWVPLTAGVVGGAGCFGLGLWIISALPTMTYGLGTYGAALGGVLLLGCGPLFAIAGIVTGIVFAVKNGGRRERLHALETELEMKRADLARARAPEVSSPLPSPTPMTLAEF